MFFIPIFVAFTLFLLANTQNTTTSITVTHITTTYKASPSLTPVAILPTFVPAVGIPKALDEYLITVTIPTALNEYLATVTTEPEFTSAQRAVKSACPADVWYAYVHFGEDPFGGWPGAREEPNWMSAMPASDVSFLSSFLSREMSIMTSSAKGPLFTNGPLFTDRPWVAKGPAPTNRPRVEVVGAALAVGAAGLAML